VTFVPPEKRWYELLHVRATDGSKGGRIYRVTCRKCGAIHDFRPNTLSDEKLKRNVERDGWQLGRYQNLHLCPICVKGKEQMEGEEPQPIAERWNDNFMIEVWNSEDGSLANPPAKQQFLDYLEWQKIAIPDSVEHKPASLAELYEDANDAQKEAFVGYLVDTLRQKVFGREGWLIEHWQRTTGNDREKLLDYLEQSHFASRHGKLIDHWKKATHAERAAILASYRHQPKSSAEISKQVVDTDVSFGERLERANKILRGPPPGTIRKSDFAKKIGSIPSTISHWLSIGLPQREDGLLDEAEATEWVENRRAVRINGDKLAATPSTGGPPMINNVTDDEELKKLAEKLYGNRRNG
jgi:hypothetical protein